jgi:hypothetical protein
MNILEDRVATERVADCPAKERDRRALITDEADEFRSPSSGSSLLLAAIGKGANTFRLRRERSAAPTCVLPRSDETQASH